VEPELQQWQPEQQQQEQQQTGSGVPGFFLSLRVNWDGDDSITVSSPAFLMASFRNG
jgi:hypothetical protein